jgi:hypothetical protein
MPDEIRRIPGNQQLLFIRQMPALLTRRTPYYETFKRFLTRHSLRDILLSTKTTGGRRALVPYGLNNLGNGVRSDVNSVMRVSSFSPPPFRPYTFAEALRQSPGFIAVMVALVGFMLWFVPHEMAIWETQRLAAVQAQEAAAKAAAEAAEAKRLEGLRLAQQQKLAAEREAQARIIDTRMRASYAAIAGGVFNSIAREGMCSSPGNVSAAFSCTTMANYSAGQLAPVNLSLSVRRQQFATLSISPQNEKRTGSFSGAAATMTVQSVFENVDINSSDETRFNPSIRAVLTSMLRAFNVPDQVLENCRSSAQGISATISGTSVSCRFVGRPATNGGLAQFTLNLTRQL